MSGLDLANNFGDFLEVLFYTIFSLLGLYLLYYGFTHHGTIVRVLTIVPGLGIVGFVTYIFALDHIFRR